MNEKSRFWAKKFVFFLHLMTRGSIFAPVQKTIKQRQPERFAEGPTEMIRTQSPHIDDTDLVAYNLAWLGGNGSPLSLNPLKVAAAKNAVEVVASLVSNIKIASEEDRKVFVEVAALSLDAANAFQQAIDSQPRSPDEREMLEEILYRIEDIAETATLAADAKFDEFLGSEIQRYLDEQDRAH